MGNERQPSELDAQLALLNVSGDEAYGNLMVAAAKCGNTLKARADQYEQLVTKYKQLEQKYEVMKVGYKTPVETEAKDAYVVVLIDCHSHKFQNDLVLDKASGGPKAASLIRDSVREYMSKIVQTNTTNWRIEAKAYANLKTLSADAHRENLADGYVRSLAPFTSGFSRPYAAFDFVDVQDEQAVQAKIRDNFKVYMQDPGCKHVFFAACCSALYMQLLSPFSQKKSKITLISGEVVDQGMQKLNMKTVAFSRVFRAPKGSTAVMKDKKLCWNYSSGKCDRRNCKFVHAPVGNNTRLLEELDNDVKKSSDLPTTGIPGLIPLNGNGARLDLYIQVPTKEQWTVYDTRSKIQKLCNAFYMRHKCEKDSCKFDHKPLEPDAYYCLQYLLKEWPCKKGGRCRRLDCISGHVCQKKGCQGSALGCKLKPDLHRVDCKVAEWVKPVVEHENENDDWSNISSDTHSVDAASVPALIDFQ